MGPEAGFLLVIIALAVGIVLTVYQQHRKRASVPAHTEDADTASAVRRDVKNPTEIKIIYSYRPVSRKAVCRHCGAETTGLAESCSVCGERL